MPKYAKTAFRPYKKDDFTFGSYINTGNAADTLGVSDMLMNSNWMVSSKPYNFFKQFTKGIQKTGIGSASYTLMWFGAYRSIYIPGRGFNSGVLRVTINLTSTGNFTLRGTVDGTITVTTAYTATGSKQEVTFDIAADDPDVANYLTVDIKGTSAAIDVTFYDINVELLTFDHADQLLNSAFGSTTGYHDSGMVDIQNLTDYDLLITSYTIEAGYSGTPDALLYTYDGTAVGHTSSTGWTLRDTQKLATTQGSNVTVTLATPFVLAAGATMGVYVTPDTSLTLVSYLAGSSVVDSDTHLKTTSYSTNDYNFGTPHTGNQIAIGFNYEVILSTDHYSEDLFIPQDTDAAVDGKPLCVATLRELMINNQSTYKLHPRVVGTYFNPWSDIDTAATDQLAFTDIDLYDEVMHLIYFKRSAGVRTLNVKIYGFTDGFNPGDTGAWCKVRFDNGQVVEGRFTNGAVTHSEATLDLDLHIPPGNGPHYLTIYGQACPDTGNYGYIYAYTIRESVEYE